MKREHRRPSVAFALVSVLGAVVLWQGIPADGLSDLFGPRDAAATSQRPSPPEVQQPATPSDSPTTAAPPAPTPTIEVLGAQAEAGEDDPADEGRAGRSEESVPAVPNAPEPSFIELEGAGLSLADLLTQ